MHSESVNHSPYSAHSHSFGSEVTNEGQHEEDTNESEAGQEDNNQVPVSDLYELEEESPTLTRLEEDDVALDMDELDLEEDGLDSECEDDDDDNI